MRHVRHFVVALVVIFTTFVHPIHVQAAELPTVPEAKAYARKVLGARQYRCLDLLATRESHWNPHALNRSSGAYGIPQALPGSKMRSAGSDWRHNPVTQVRWMIRYVDVRYGSACNAWAHSRAWGWY